MRKPILIAAGVVTTISLLLTMSILAENRISQELDPPARIDLHELMAKAGNLPVQQVEDPI